MTADDRPFHRITKATGLVTRGGLMRYLGRRGSLVPSPPRMHLDKKHNSLSSNPREESGVIWLNAEKSYPGGDGARIERLPNFRMRTTGWAKILRAENWDVPAAASINYALPETLCASDDRVQIPNTALFPYKCIARLYITGRSGDRWVGTGFFISPRCVITNGHVVFPDRDWALEIEVVPGQCGELAPFGSQVSQEFRCVEGWTAGPVGDPDYDYGAVILPDTTLYSRIRAHFGFAVHNDPVILNNSGYPGDKPFGTQWYNAGPVVHQTHRRFQYMIDSAGAQSGSPVWVPDGRDRVAVGIQGYGGCPNFAIRCTEDVALNWANWSRA